MRYITCNISAGGKRLLMQTTMTIPHLPPETLDHLIDLLHNEPETLEQCCLVSKSWVPRTRIHLFADIKFRSADDLKAWKKTFPDVTNSPAYHARTLLVGCPQLVTASDAEEGGWIRAFSGVVGLGIGDDGDCFRATDVSLAPFHKLSPTLKSLRVGPIFFPYPRLFDLICSFPLLEDLSLRGHDMSSINNRNPYGPQTVIPSASPALTGSLNFHVLGAVGVGVTAHQLLELPNGVHFRELVLSWTHKGDILWITELVERCSHTLESLDVTEASGRTFVHICVRTDGLTCSQSERGQTRSTSRKRQNSEMWFFDPDG